MEEIEYNFKRTSAQIETLLDKISAEGDIAKVYNTTLDLFGIEDGSVVTPEQKEEVIRIVDKFNNGYNIVCIREDEGNPGMFNAYGTVNVESTHDMSSVYLTVNFQGDVMSYKIYLLDESPWTVTNKTSGGKAYYLTTRGLLDNSDNDTFSLDSVDIFTLESMRRTNNLLVDSSIFYTGRDSSGNQYIVPLNFYTDTENEPFYASVSYTDPNNGKSYTFEIHSNDDGSDYWASKVTEVSGGGGSNIKKVTQAEYDALANKEEILYIIIG